MIPTRYPSATWRPVSYVGEARPFGVLPLGWILHVTVMRGSPWGVFEHAPAGSRRFSHLWIGADGRVEQYAPLTHASWAQGAGNSLYWSVESEGYPGDPLTDAQLDALAAWHAWCGTTDRLAQQPGETGIGTHYMGGSAWGGHTCPDPAPGAGPRSHQRAEIVRRAAALRTGGDDMQLSELASWDVSSLVGLPPHSLNFQTLIARTYTATQATATAVTRGTPVILSAAQVDALGAAVAAHLPPGATADPKALAAALADELAVRLARSHA